MCTNALRAGERHRPDRGVLEQRRASRAIAVHHIEHTGRQPAAVIAVSAIRCEICGAFRGLQYDGIAEGYCRCGFPQRNGEGKVPRSDQRDRAKRIAKRELQGVCGLGRDHFAHVADRFTGVETADHCRPTYFSPCFADRLADLARHRLRSSSLRAAIAAPHR